MKPPKVVFVCQECGAQSPKWMGKCVECGAWNSFVEERPAPDVAPGNAATNRYAQFSTSTTAKLYAEVETANAEAPDLDESGQFLNRANPQLSGDCVEMDTVIADQNGRWKLSGASSENQIEGQPRLAGA